MTGSYGNGYRDGWSDAYADARDAVQGECEELREALEAVRSWLYSEFRAAPDSGDAVEASAKEIWLTVCEALAASEGAS